MVWRDSFSQEEWRTLQQAPVLAFLAVAAADGKIDDKETRAFGNVLAIGPALPEGLASEVLTSLLKEKTREEVWAQLPSTGLDVLDALRSVNTLLDAKVPHDEADTFKRALVLIGVNVGRASGGFLGLGDKLSREEKGAIQVVIDALNVSVLSL